MLPVPNRPQSPAKMPPPPRPESPTFQRLLNLAEQEQWHGKLVVPTTPVATRRATVEEWGAITNFNANIKDADPNGLKRHEGEFFQTFTSKPKELDYVANHEIHYNPGGKVEPMPASVFPPGTTEMIHSHPPGAGSAFPSAQDYLGTYLINNGNERGIGSILYDVGSRRYFAFEGKVNPHTNLPEFTRITQPTMQDNNDWMIRHGHMDPPAPPAAPRATAPHPPGNPPEEMFFGPMDGVP